MCVCVCTYVCIAFCFSGSYKPTFNTFNMNNNHIYIYAHEVKRSILCDHNLSSPYFLRQGLSLTLELTTCLDQQVPRTLLSLPSCAGVTQKCHRT